MAKILDWNKYIEAAVQTVAEGCVLLKNDNKALPLDKSKETAVFGRIQLHYYKSGTGSGGMVNVSKVTGITDGLIEAGANINKELLSVYKKWDEENPYDLGAGWGSEPWSQQEMPLEDSLAAKIAGTSETAIVIIGRTAGEEQDNKAEKGAYFLSDDEAEMLKTVRKHFKKVIVLLNVGGIIDMGFVEEIKPDAVMYVWQGGMTGGTGVARILTGEASPSGKLPDTIARSVSDYPSDENFGSGERDFYAEDIYVGYRYFETFAKDKVLYPFGFGLSYTTFEITPVSFSADSDKAEISVSVKNTGDFKGKEVVQLYCSAPQGKLGKPARVLCGYEKTRELAPGETQTVSFTVNFSDLASYDDSGVTGNKNAYVLEAGEYLFFAGSNVRSAEKCGGAVLPEKVVSRHKQALAPVLPFERIKPKAENGAYAIEKEPVPLNTVDEKTRRSEALPEEIPFTGDKGIKLSDVKAGRSKMSDFIAQLSDNDLSCIIRGEGMGSPKVTAGTASAFGGVSAGLKDFGIPCCCCSDGPSGMRLDCGTKAFSLPNGTLIASTFNKELVTALFSVAGLEIAANNVECLLGPGMNIHRHPLNGRNFEYFSEDPYLTGTMGASELKGLHTAGVTGTIKHFCGNNRETHRHEMDSVISERALREIYLKGFEIAVKQGGATSIMTTYGSVNGLWTAGNYDLTTIILREEWGFKGVAMTDWWADINRRGEKPDKRDFAAMAAAQNDLYMVCADGEKNDDNTLEALADGRLTRAELQRCAANICGFVMASRAMERLENKAEPIEIINRPDSEDNISGDDVTFFPLDTRLTIPLESVSVQKGKSHVFALDVKIPGRYRITVTASSQAGELAQIPVTLFSTGTPWATFTWNGTGGKPVSFSKDVPMFSRFTTIRLYFAQNGLELKDISFELIKE
ncbi:MAG: glycoside hydrolase family 3 protein [Ruminiclostridium sp.]